VRYGAVETDPDVVCALRARAVSRVYGDAALVVMTIPDADHAQLTVARTRAINARVPIWRARTGATSGSRCDARAPRSSSSEAAATFIRHALHLLAVPDDRLAVYLERFREAMSSAGSPRGPNPPSPRCTSWRLPLGQSTVSRCGTRTSASASA